MRVLTLACAAALLAAAPPMVPPATAQSPSAAPALQLDRGRESFKRGDWQSAIEVINVLIYPELQLARKEQVVEAHILLGAAYYQTGNRERAREEFRRALEIEPEQSIGTRLYSEGAIRLFDETKTDLRIAKEREDEKRRIAQRLKEIEDYKKSLIVYETHPYYVNFVPFGAGQLQNRQLTKGILFAASQAVTGGISAGIFLYLASKYGLVSTSVPIEEGRTVRNLQGLEIATGAAFLGLYAWGVIDALLHYKPRRRVEGEDSLLPPELRDPRKPTRGKPAPKTSLRDRVHVHPVLVPSGGAGLGLSLELPLMPSLRLTAPGQPPTVYHLHKKITSLGSGRDNDVVLPDPLVTDGYAIHFDGQTYTVFAPKKTEFVVNGKKRSKHKLSHDERLVIGSCDLRFVMIDEAPPAEEEAAETVADVDAYTKLYEFSERLIHQRDLGEMLDALMDAVIEITNADKGFLILLEDETLDVKVARNLNREHIADAVSQLSDSIIAKVVRSRRPVIVSDALRDDEFGSSKSVMQLKVSSVICVPLLDRGRLLGIIYVGNDSIRDLFQQDTMRVLTVFSSQASLIVANAMLMNELRVDNRRLNERLEQYRFGEIVGTSPPMQQVFRKVEKIAATDISVLITGETGTGKELIAREIHTRSPRTGKPFITINCGAIPENLLESELFGHVKGAFTGAVANKLGKFQAADGGTLFLDEIGEMPIELQVKLLRAIQEKVVYRVGDTRAETVDIRILAATNRELEKEIAGGRFREDLYYRLNVVNVELPPLRVRGEDVLVIARYLLSRYAREYDSKVKGLSPNASVAIRKHNWPGNIRELENRIKKAIVLCESTVIGPDDLGLTPDVLPQILTLADAKEKFQREYINEVLALNNGNRTKTARDLGVDPRTVFRHLEKEGADPDDGTGAPV